MSQNGDPTTWALSTWILAICMAAGGGLINIIQTIKTGERIKVSFTSFLGEFFTAGFIGVGIFMAMLSYDFSQGLAAFSACVTGHYSTRLLFKLELLIDYKIDQIIGKNHE